MYGIFAHSIFGKIVGQIFAREKPHRAGCRPDTHKVYHNLWNPFFVFLSSILFWSIAIPENWLSIVIAI